MCSTLIEDAKPKHVIVDHELLPSQIRNLERATGAQVLNRTGVIVEIFHRHGHTREARLQVEMTRLPIASMPELGNQQPSPDLLMRSGRIGKSSEAKT